jgi:hypothetical protein
MRRRTTTSVLLWGLLAATPTALAGDGPATELSRMSWDEPCAAIRDHLATALDANAAIPADTRTAIEAKLAEADVDAEREACLAPLKDAYDRLVAAYERTPASANVLGGATAAPEEPSKVDPETIEGPRTGERIGGD